MSYNWEEFQAAYQSAPSHVKEWIDSDACYNLCNRVEEDQGLNSNVHQNLMQTISRYYLGVIPENQLAIKLVTECGIDEGTALKVSIQIKEII